MKTDWTSVGNGTAPVPGLDVVAGNAEVAGSAGLVDIHSRLSRDHRHLLGLGATQHSALWLFRYAGIRCGRERREQDRTGWALDDRGIGWVGHEQDRLRLGRENRLRPTDCCSSAQHL